MRRQLFALTFVALPLAVPCSAQSTDRRHGDTRRRRSPRRTGRYRDRRARSQDRSLHRLLPVRLRRLDREEPGAGRSPIVRPLHGAAGAQLHGPAPHPRNARRATAIGRRPPTSTPRAWTSRRSRRRVSTPIAPDLATIDEILNPDDLPVLVAHLHAFGVPALFRFGAQTDLEDATNAIANVDQAGLALPDRDYYLKTDAALGRAARQVRRASSQQDVHARRRAGRTGGRRRRRRCSSIETALATAMLDRVEAARSRQHAAPDDDQRAAGAVAELQLAQVRGRRRSAAAARRSTSPCPTIVQALERADRVDADGRSQGVSALAAAARVGRPAAEGVRRRRLRFLQPDARRPAGAAAALAPLRRPRPTSGSAKRSARRSSRRRSARRPRPTRCRWCRTSRTRCARTSTPRRG